MAKTSDEISEETTVGALQKQLKTWATISTFCFSVAGAWYAYRDISYTNAREILQLRNELLEVATACNDRYKLDVIRHAFGPDGFLDPAIRTGLEAHLRAILKEHTREVERNARKWRSSFKQLNPTLSLPVDED